MRNALSLAIGAGLSFDASDFETFAQDFRWGYWVTENPEWIYHNAIINGNDSCASAWEKHVGRKPFRANKVDLVRWETGGEIGGFDGYINRSSCAHRQREKLAEGFGFPIEGLQWWVTGFDDAAGIVRLASYQNHWPNGKPKRLQKLTHDQLAEICPAPKKQKISEEVCES